METFSPNKTLSGMKKDSLDNIETNYIINKNNTVKGKLVNNLDNFSETNPENRKLNLLNDYIYGNEFLNENNNKNVHQSSNQLNPFDLKENEDKNILENNNNIFIEIKGDKNNDSINVENVNGNPVQRRTIKKLKHRGGPEKLRNSNMNNNNNNFDLDYKVNNVCSLNMENDLNCGCAGTDNGCIIF